MPMKPPGSAFLTETADFYHTDLSAGDEAAGALPVDELYASEEPCSIQRLSISRATDAGAVVQVTANRIFVGRSLPIRLEDLIVDRATGRKYRVAGELDAFEVMAEGRQ